MIFFLIAQSKWNADGEAEKTDKHCNTPMIAVGLRGNAVHRQTEVNKNNFRKIFSSVSLANIEL